MSAMSAMDAAVVTVKNTFVEIPMFKETPARRNSSIPPSLRLAREPKSADSDSGSDSGKSTTICPFSPSHCERSPSESGTDFGSLGEVASWADLSEGCADGYMSPQPGMAAAQAFFVAGAMIPALVPLPPVTKLKTSAKAWAPSKPAAPKAAGKFWTSFHAAVMIVKTTLEQAGIPSRIVVGENPSGWLIQVNVLPEALTFQTKEHLLSQAKQSLLFAALKSQNVYVMGYKAKPFLKTPGGFGAILCGMEDESTACWSFYEYGSCERGNRCKWCHPTTKMNVDVVIQLAGYE